MVSWRRRLILIKMKAMDKDNLMYTISIRHVLYDVRECNGGIPCRRCHFYMFGRCAKEAGPPCTAVNRKDGRNVYMTATYSSIKKESYVKRGRKKNKL